jgi:hypothetical protein
MRTQNCPRFEAFIQAVLNSNTGPSAVKLLDCILLVVRTDAARDRPQTQQQ